MWLMQNGMTNPNNAGAAAYSYMHIMGIVSVGLMWLRMASAAARMIEAGEGDGRFLEAKIMTARFYAERIMPDAGALTRKIEGGAEAVLALEPAMFAVRSEVPTSELQSLMRISYAAFCLKKQRKQSHSISSTDIY